jgi:imidazole glycerol-phosphate synthase subunit HisF
MGTFPVRIIPRLDIKGENVVKGIQLEGLRIVGAPGELSRKYYADGADEIVFMDVVASLYGRNQILGIVQEAAREIFVPMTVGGGLRTLDDIRAVLRSGADKVAINTAAIDRPEFLDEAARAFGSQCIVLSIEAKRQEDGWEAYTDNGRERTGRDVMEWAFEAQSRGVGELLITSVDHEGTRRGFDKNLLEALYPTLNIPIIACGGGGNADHVAEILAAPLTDAVCCASIFHFDTCPIGELKSDLGGRDLAVRQ